MSCTPLVALAPCGSAADGATQMAAKRQETLEQELLRRMQQMSDADLRLLCLEFRIDFQTLGGDSPASQALSAYQKIINEDDPALVTDALRYLQARAPRSPRADAPLRPRVDVPAPPTQRVWVAEDLRAEIATIMGDAVGEFFRELLPPDPGPVEGRWRRLIAGLLADSQLVAATAVWRNAAIRLSPAARAILDAQRAGAGGDPSKEFLQIRRKCCKEMLDAVQNYHAFRDLKHAHDVRMLGFGLLLDHAAGTGPDRPILRFAHACCSLALCMRESDIDTVTAPDNRQWRERVLEPLAKAKPENDESHDRDSVAAHMTSIIVLAQKANLAEHALGAPGANRRRRKKPLAISVDCNMLRSLCRRINLGCARPVAFGVGDA